MVKKIIKRNPVSLGAFIRLKLWGKVKTYFPHPIPVFNIIYFPIKKQMCLFFSFYLCYAKWVWIHNLCYMLFNSEQETKQMLFFYFYFKLSTQQLKNNKKATAYSSMKLNKHDFLFYSLSFICLCIHNYINELNWPFNLNQLEL
jgi:hypothetical protein